MSVSADEELRRVRAMCQDALQQHETSSGEREMAEAVLALVDEGHHVCEVPAGHPGGLTLDQVTRILFALDLALPNGTGDLRYVSLSLGDLGRLQWLLAREALRLKIELEQLEIVETFEARYGRPMRKSALSPGEEWL